MPIFTPSARLAFRVARPTARQALRARKHNLDLGLPFIPTCPTPTCECSDVPAGLDIEREQDLNGTVAPYQQHLLIPTGQSDWKSKIEDEGNTAAWGSLIANVKSLLGPKGEFHDPYHNVVVSTSSFVPVTTSETGVYGVLFPSFQLVTEISSGKPELESFVRSFLLPPTLHSGHDKLPAAQRGSQTRNSEAAVARAWNGRIRPVNVPTILICSHQSRDSRCGVLGPLLHAEFSSYLNKHHTLRMTPDQPDIYDNESGEVKSFASHPQFQTDAVFSPKSEHYPVNVGMISHVGGHKWAGNVIVYIPPDYCISPVLQDRHSPKSKDKLGEHTSAAVIHDTDELPVEEFTANRSPLAGKGIWYGRVEPRHVEGIVEQTIGHGKIIRELFRGGINPDGSMIRI